MLNLSKHDCHVIASVYQDDPFDYGRHLGLRDALDYAGMEYQEVEGVYTHTSGKQVAERAIVVSREDWDVLYNDPADYFGQQESILMVFGRTYHTASLVYLEDKDGEVASPVHFKSFRSVDREYALEQPCYTRHDDTYYVAA